MTSATPKKFSRWAISLLNKWQRSRPSPASAASPASPLAPLGLEPQQVEALRRLRQSPHWRHYQQLLETVTLNNVEQLLHALPHDQYLFYCGSVFACRRLMELPDAILAKVTELEDHAHARTESQAAHERARADTFLNTPFWESYIADEDGRQFADAVSAAARADAERATRSYTDLG